MSGKLQASRNAAATERRPADAASGAAMSGERPWASGATTAQHAAGARHAFGDLRVSAGGAPPLVIGKIDDAYEIEAERAADRALAEGARDGASNGLTPARPGLVQRRANATAGAAHDLPRSIEHAATEGRPLASAQRTFFEQRLGQDFGAVRIHDGPASAAAASSAGAQAFAHGQNIYFGAGEYRPDSRPGQWLIAHELAHTVQQRPNVIARRAMDGAAIDATPPESDSDGSGMHLSAGVDADGSQPPAATADQVSARLGSDSSDTSGDARRRFAQLSPRARQRTMLTLRARQTESPGDEPQSARALRAIPAAREAPRASRQDGASSRSASPGKTPNVTESREAQSARMGAGPPTPAAAPPAESQRRPAAIASVQPSIIPRLPPNVSHATPPARTLGPAPESAPATAPGRGAAGPTAAAQAERPGTPAGANTAPNAVHGSAHGGAPGGGAPSAAISQSDDDRPLRLADLLERNPERPEAAPQTSAPEPQQRVGGDETAAPPRPQQAASPAATGSGPTAEGADQAAVQMESLASQLETALVDARQNLQMQGTSIGARVRQQAAGTRAAIHSEVEQAVGRIQAGQTGLLAELSGNVAAAHGQIDTDLAGNKADAVLAGVTSQQNINGIFSGHRGNVERTVNRNIAAAEKLRADKAEGARQQNRADIKAVYHKARPKMNAYPGTRRGAYISGAVFDVADGTAQKMRDQEPEILNAIAEVTAPLPQYFRDQGAQALNGFDVNLPQILASVESGVAQVHADQQQRASEAHSRLDFVADQVRTEINAIAATAIEEARAFGPQLTAQLDQELARVLHAIAVAPRDVMSRITPPIEEAVTLLRTGEDPDVDAAKALTAGLTGFIADSESSTIATIERAAEASHQRFQGIHVGARQAMHAQVGRTDTMWQGSRIGFTSTIKEMVSNFDTGFGASVTALQETLGGTEQSIVDQLAPVVDQLDSSFHASLSDAERQIDGRIADGLGKNAEALNELDGKMEEAAGDAAFEWDHPVLSALEFIAGILVGIVEVLAIVVLLIAITIVLSSVLGVSMLAAGLILLAGMAAFSIGYAFGARLAAGQGFGTAFVGALGDFAHSVPGMLYDMTGIPKLRRAFSDERMTPYQRGKLIGEGGTELVLAIFMVRGAAKGIAGGFRKLGPFRPPTTPIEPVALPETAAPRPVVDTVAPRPPPAAEVPRPVEPVAPRAPGVGETVAPRPAPTTPPPRPVEPLSGPRPAADSIPRPSAEAPRPVGEPPVSRPAPASQTPRPLADPAAPRPQAAKPLPDNVRPIESAEPGRAGDQPRLRTQRPTTSAEEFAARQRARAGGRLGGGEPPDVQPQVQRQPVAQAAGAEGYTPRQLEPVQPAEGSAGGRGAPGGRSPMDVRASGEPPGAGRPRPGPSAGGGKGPRPVQAEAGGRPSPGRAGSPRGTGRPTVVDEPAPQGGTAESSPADQPAPGERPGSARGPQRTANQASAERPTKQPGSNAGRGGTSPRQAGNRVTHEKFGDGTVVRQGEGKTTVRFDDGTERTIMSERLEPTERPAPAGAEPPPREAPTRGGRGRGGRGRGGRGGAQEGEPRETQAQKRAHARRDAETARIQREFEGAGHEPKQNATTVDEALSRDEGFGRGTEEPGDVGGAEVRRGPGGRQVVSEDRAVAEAAGSEFEKPMVRDFAATQPRTAQTFASATKSWTGLRARFPTIGRLFGASRPDALSVDLANRRITLFDATSRFSPEHWGDTLEYMQRLVNDPAVQAEFDGFEVVAGEQYWETGFSKFKPIRTVQIGGAVPIK